MIERHLARLRRRHDISDAEERIIRASVSEYRTYGTGETFIHAGELLRHSTLLLDGLMCRYKDLKNGQRQIAELHLPGDFADLHSFSLKRLDHNVMALTPCRVALVPHENIMRITEEYPHLARVFWFSTNLDAAIHREWIFSLGSKPAVARLAALFHEMLERLRIVGLADDEGYAFPLSQEQLGECMGLTSVHVNRTLRDLRERNILTFRKGRVTIHDLDALRELGEFDSAYLYLERHPR